VNDDRLLQEIERYYGSRSAPPETVEFLCGLARRGAPDALAAKRSPMARRVLAVAAAFAALAGATAIGYRLGVEHGPLSELRPDGSSGGATIAREAGSTGPAPTIAEKSAIADEPTVTDAEKYRGTPVVATIPTIDGEDDQPPETDGAARLLLMRVYAEWCPRSPRLSPAYENLVEHYKNEPLLIVSFDVTDPARRRQAGYMAHSLGLLKLLGHKWEPSTILLIDRESGEILETIREVEERPRMEHALALALPNGNTSLRQP
jgi:thiol-disulfide isomerase/thioredoxin